jgi:hypothetical protein
VSAKRKPTRGARPAGAGGGSGAKAAAAGASAPEGGTAVKGGADATRAGAPAGSGAAGKRAAAAAKSGVPTRSGVSAKRGADAGGRGSGEAGAAAKSGAPKKAGAAAKAAGAAENVPAAPAAPRSRRLAAAALIAGLEGAALALFGLGMLGYAVLGHPTSRGDATGSGVTLAVIALLPLVAASGLWRARRWSRGPALIIQIVALPVSWTLLHAGSPALWAGIGLGVAALAELVLLVHPAATEALGIGRGAES